MSANSNSHSRDEKREKGCIYLSLWRQRCEKIDTFSDLPLKTGIKKREKHIQLVSPTQNQEMRKGGKSIPRTAVGRMGTERKQTNVHYTTRHTGTTQSRRDLSAGPWCALSGWATWVEAHGSRHAWHSGTRNTGHHRMNAMACEEGTVYSIEWSI